MAPAETNHGSGHVGTQPNPPQQHGPPTPQTEHASDSISLLQTPDTAQRARGLTDNDHTGTDISSLLAAGLAADGALPHPGPWVPFPNSPPRPDARLTPSPPPPPPTGLQGAMAWLQGQGPPFGQGQGPPFGQGRVPPFGQGQGPPFGQGQGPPFGQGQGPPIGLGLTLYPPAGDGAALAAAGGYPNGGREGEEGPAGDGAAGTCGGQAPSEEGK